MKPTDAPVPRRTLWFEGADLPARAGVYERRPPAGPFSCWDGARWRRDAKTVEAAMVQPIGSAFQLAAWRGLRAAPAAPCPTCGGHTVIDRGVDADAGADLIEECPDC